MVQLVIILLFMQQQKTQLSAYSYLDKKVGSNHMFTLIHLVIEIVQLIIIHLLVLGKKLAQLNVHSYLSKS